MPAVRAQSSPSSTHPEIRVDAIIRDRRTSLQGGAGVQIPLGYYVRIGVDGAAGVDVGNGHTDPSGRADAVVRFLFDPFRQTAWGLSAGGGVTAMVRTGDRVRPLLVAVFDLEGPRGSRGYSPAFQVGLGGGVRVGAVIRWAAQATR